MKKVLPLLMLASACLASCGESSVYGNYTFTLGRQGENETRVSIEMDLKNEAYKESPEFKKFNLSVDANLPNAFKDMDESSLVSSVLYSLILSGGEVGDKLVDASGYYKVLDLKDPKYGNKVKIGFDLEIVDTIIRILGFDPTNIISNFVVCYCDTQSFTLQAPVSITDLQMQLAWYGTYIDMDPYVMAKINSLEDFARLLNEGKITDKSFKQFDLTEYGTLPGEQNAEVRFGSHPTIPTDDDEDKTPNQVKEMNETYQGVFSNTIVYENIDGVAGEKIGSIYKEINESDNYYFFPYDKTFNMFETPIDVIMKKNVGELEPDFSEEKEIVLSVSTNKYEDGSHPFTYKYKNEEDGTFDWADFYEKPFVFRDTNDIKIQLKKD